MAKDILIDDQYDLRIEEGDLVLGDGSQQQTALLLETFAGDWRDMPSLGVGAPSRLNGPFRTQELEADLRRQMKVGALTLSSIKIAEDGQIQIEV